MRIKPCLPIEKSKADLDSTDPQLIEMYKNVALESAIEAFTKENRYGPYGVNNYYIISNILFYFCKIFI